MNSEALRRWISEKCCDEGPGPYTFINALMDAVDSGELVVITKDEMGPLRSCPMCGRGLAYGVWCFDEDCEYLGSIWGQKNE